MVGRDLTGLLVSCVPPREFPLDLVAYDLLFLFYGSAAWGAILPALWGSRRNTQMSHTVVTV